MKPELYPHYWVNHLSFLIRKRVSQNFAADGFKVTPEEWAVLLILKDKGEMTPTALSDASVRDKTTVTRMIDKLVRKGLVDRIRDGDDRRVVKIRLTPRGGQTFASLAVIAQSIIARSFDGIAEADLETTVATLAKMASNLKEGDRDEL